MSCVADSDPVDQLRDFLAGSVVDPHWIRIQGFDEQICRILFYSRKKNQIFS
jgi:hypothetical protein